MAYWVAFRVKSGARNIVLKSFDSQEEAVRHEMLMRKSEPEAYVSVFTAQTEGEARQQAESDIARREAKGPQADDETG